MTIDFKSLDNGILIHRLRLIDQSFESGCGKNIAGRKAINVLFLNTETNGVHADVDDVIETARLGVELSQVSAGSAHSQK